MQFKLTRRKKRYITIAVITIALIPIFITAFELLTTNAKTVVFLDNFHPVLARTIEVYYMLLIVAGVVWVLLQVKAIWKLKNEKVKNEVLHLQSQVNPHFFFNMLNNLYGLIDVDAEKAKALILRLSDLMRYSIYESERKTVTLEEEVAYLKNYVELHQMRYHKDIDITFDVSIDTAAYKVMPLLYIILVENAFKHGVEHIRADAFVHISLTAAKGNIHFEIKNNFDADALSRKAGIGIQNLKRRLALVYPNQHQLTLKHLETVYTATLQLTL